MSNQINHIEIKAATLADEVKQHFARVGEDAKQHVLANFKTALEKDVNGLKEIVNQTVAEHGQTIADNLHDSLTKSISSQFGGSVFGSLLNNLILPTVFSAISGNKIDIRSPKFREAAGQTLVDIGNSLARSSERNG